MYISWEKKSKFPSKFQNFLPDTDTISPQYHYNITLFFQLNHKQFSLFGIPRKSQVLPFHVSLNDKKILRENHKNIAEELLEIHDPLLKKNAGKDYS